MWGEGANPDLSWVIIYKKYQIIKIYLLRTKKKERKLSDKHGSTPLPGKTQPKSENKSMPLSAQNQQNSENPLLPAKIKIMGC